MQALKELMDEIKKYWVPENPLQLNEAILALKSYMQYHQLFAISYYFDIANGMPTESIPSPAKALQALKMHNLMEQIISMTGNDLNAAFENSLQRAQDSGRVFSPQNWSKAKASINAIRDAVRSHYNMAGFISGGAQLKKQLQQGLKLDNADFEARWTAD